MCLENRDRSRELHHYGVVFEIFAIEVFLIVFLQKCAATRERVRGIVSKTVLKCLQSKN